MRALTLAVLLWLCGLPAAAQTFDALFEALKLPEMIDIMSEEGIRNGIDVRESMFPGRGGAQWPQVVERIYEPERMQDVVRQQMKAQLPPEHIELLTAFFQSERGQRIVELEVGAREALQIDGVEEQANAAYADAKRDGNAVYIAVKKFIEVNDLVEVNVVGALNSNLAFYRGLAAGGGIESVDDEMLLADVWASEPEVRESTETWVFSYLMLAYGPLPLSDIEAYSALSETEAGQALNAAIMGAFDVLFVDISRALGLGAARFMGGDDI